MRWIKWGVGFVVLVIVLGVVTLMLLPADRIARIAADQLRNLTGRDVTISGDVSLTFWPVLGVSAGGLEVGNAEWAKAGPMLTAAQAAIGVDAAALLRGEIKITNIEAQSPTIRLEQRLDGRASWQFTDATGAAQITTETTPARQGRPLSIQRLALTDATLIYDAEAGDLVTYEGVDLALDWPVRTGPADISANLRPNRAEVQVEGRIDGFSSFLEGNVQPLRMQVSTTGGTMSFVGRGALTGALAGDLWLKTGDTAAFLTALGVQTGQLPQTLGQSTDIKVQMTLTPDRRLSLRDLVANLGGNTLRGNADMMLNGTPFINAQLTAGTLDLSALRRGEDGTAAEQSTTPQPDGWSRMPIDASGLSAFNGEISLIADSIDLGAIKLDQTRALLRNDRSRMVFELREVRAYDGVLTGEFVVNNRGGLSVGGSIRAGDVQMRPLLGDLADLDRFSGTGNADLSFLGSGGTLQAIMQSLSGSGALHMTRGTIDGIDLDELMGSFDVEGGSTAFDTLDAAFTMRDGVLRNDDLLMLLPNFNATGQGQVNLGERTLDYTVTPKALRINSGRGLAIPVRIVGPWADPSIRPDLKAVIDLNFSEEKARVEERVKQKLEEKIQEELGLTQEPGQSLEDAVKDQLEDKLKRELFRLFD